MSAEEVENAWTRFTVYDQINSGNDRKLSDGFKDLEKVYDKLKEGFGKCFLT